MMKKELLADGDVLLRDEDAYIELVQNGDFDIIFADGCMERMIPEFKGIFVDTRHFAGVWKVDWKIKILLYL